MRLFLVTAASLLLLFACGDDKPKQAKTAPAKTAASGTPAPVATPDKPGPVGGPQSAAQPAPATQVFAQMCSQCHKADDVKRYESTFQPMYQMMVNPAAWMEPEAYARMMQPAMDPATYTEWYNAWMKQMKEMAPGKEAGK